MELSPLDLRNQTFNKKSFGGYDPEEVHAFLNQAATELEKQSRARTELTERLKVAEERVGYYKLIEKTLQDSVVTMQKTVDEIKHNADREAELIVAEAKARAVREVEETKKRADDLRSEIEVLKQQRTNYFIRIRALIRGQEELLQAMEREQAEHRSPEELAAEAMAFRNKRLESATLRKTGAQQVIPPTAAPVAQAPHPVAVAPAPAAPKTQAIPVVPQASTAPQQSAQQQPATSPRSAESWNSPWGPYGQQPPAKS
jgi:cell division initiation protein